MEIDFTSIMTIPLRRRTNNRIKRLTEERQSIFETLLQYSDYEKLRRGTIKNIADLFQINVITVNRIWKRVVASFANGKVVAVSRKFPKIPG